MVGVRSSLELVQASCNNSTCNRILGQQNMPSDDKISQMLKECMSSHCYVTNGWVNEALMKPGGDEVLCVT